MDLDKGMAETVAPEMPSAAEIAACKWLPDDELKVYSGEYGRTGFQGGLQGYRIGSSGRFTSEQQTVLGPHDRCAVHVHRRQERLGRVSEPGRAGAAAEDLCTQMTGTHLVDGAGHWVQQEQPESVSRLLVQFLRG